MNTLLEKPDVIGHIGQFESKKVSPYHVIAKFNDEVHEFDTYDLDQAILSLKPKTLKTKIIFRVERDGKFCERLLFVMKGKKLFINKIFRDTFIRQLIFKSNG